MPVEYLLSSCHHSVIGVRHVVARDTVLVSGALQRSLVSPLQTK